MATPLSLDLVTSSRDITEPRPSPDGRWIGFIRRWQGRAELLVVPIGGGAAIAPRIRHRTVTWPGVGRGAGSPGFPTVMAWCSSGRTASYGSRAGPRAAR